MPSGIPNLEKARVREAYATGAASRGELLEAETASYHAPGTCTFYGTANTNQMLMEMMGLHLPGTAFVNPGTPLREALTRAAAKRACILAREGAGTLSGIVDARAIVNGVVGLMATGGSTNHTLHLPAIARAAGIILEWEDLADISHVDAAARAGLSQRRRRRESLPSQRRHGVHRARTHRCRVGARRRADRGRRGTWRLRARTLSAGRQPWTGAIPPRSRPIAMCCDRVSDPFDAEGGLRLLRGNLGRAVIKVSAVAPQHRKVEAPARVFHSQEEFLAAFAKGEMNRDVIVVLRFQGPKANGMPELHKLTPPLSSLQGKGFAVGLVTDGRMSGASGKIPAAIHVTPEAKDGGAIAHIQDGDVICIDAQRGALEARVDTGELMSRPVATQSPPNTGWAVNCLRRSARLSAAPMPVRAC